MSASHCPPRAAEQIKQKCVSKQSRDSQRERAAVGERQLLLVSGSVARSRSELAGYSWKKDDDDRSNTLKPPTPKLVSPAPCLYATTDCNRIGPNGKKRVRARVCVAVWRPDDGPRSPQLGLRLSGPLYNNAETQTSGRQAEGAATDRLTSLRGAIDPESFAQALRFWTGNSNIYPALTDASGNLRGI